MQRPEILDKILETKIVAILRVKNAKHVIPSAEAIRLGGISSIEVSLNTPEAFDCIKELSKINGILPGVGTVTTVKQAKEAIDAGAEFVVTPVSRKDVIDVCHEYGKPVLSGALTPSEIYQAYDWGADIVKVFPAEMMTMKYIKAIKAPFPQIKLMPTGGVNSGNIDQWFEMGADCVGIGGCFTRASILENEEWHLQTERANLLVKNIQHFYETK